MISYLQFRNTLYFIILKENNIHFLINFSKIIFLKKNIEK